MDKIVRSGTTTEYLNMDSSGDEDHFFFNVPPKVKQPKVNPPKPTVQLTLPQQVAKGNPVVRRTSSKSKASSKDVRQPKIDNVLKSKPSSSRVRSEKKGKGNVKLPKYLPTDEDYAYDRKERREAQLNSKVMGLSHSDKEALIAQRINQVMGDTIDDKMITKEKFRFHSGEVPIGISSRLRPSVKKGCPLWRFSGNQGDCPGVSASCLTTTDEEMKDDVTVTVQGDVNDVMIEEDVLALAEVEEDMVVQDVTIQDELIFQEDVMIQDDVPEDDVMPGDDVVFQEKVTIQDELLFGEEVTAYMPRNFVPSPLPFPSPVPLEVIEVSDEDIDESTEVIHHLDPMDGVRFDEADAFDPGHISSPLTDFVSEDDWEHDSIIASIPEMDLVPSHQPGSRIQIKGWTESGLDPDNPIRRRRSTLVELPSQEQVTRSKKPEKSNAKIMLPKRGRAPIREERRSPDVDVRGRGGSVSPPRCSPVIDPNVTPMLNYSTIDTPILKAELKRFGLKPFPRSKAKKLLRHIYKETH